MSDKENCGDYEIFQDEEGMWVVENSITKHTIGKFQNKNDALKEVASILQSVDDSSENESVC